MAYSLSLLKLKSAIESADELAEEVVYRYPNIEEINVDLAKANIMPVWRGHPTDSVSCQIDCPDFNGELVATWNDGFLLTIHRSLFAALIIAKNSGIFHVYDHQTGVLYRPSGEVIQ